MPDFKFCPYCSAELNEMEARKETGTKQEETVSDIDKFFAFCEELQAKADFEKLYKTFHEATHLVEECDRHARHRKALSLYSTELNRIWEEMDNLLTKMGGTLIRMVHS